MLVFYENFEMYIRREMNKKVSDTLQTALTSHVNYQNMVKICKKKPYCVSNRVSWLEKMLTDQLRRNNCV
jgi:hypothetical protein